ncbi:class I SAM-dependent methyltransferase [Halioglobus sp. Uisw_031]|jgi:ubiquinone/menaquinone biosynthesis C-methylase UbiE|uniref:class I SAM-dependent methyltransferase n=1 Tax=Halioglobus sp. Uisw_031 TaxID=3230977 RepID=UPI0039E742A4
MRDLAKLYQIRFSDTNRYKKDLVWQVLCEHYFQQFIPHSSIVLEVATGYGEFIRHITASRKIAVDLNPDSKDCLPEEIEFHLGSATNLTMIKSESIDVCFSSNFFEHLPSKEVMDEVLCEVWRTLKPGGLYITMQPNLRFEPGRYWDYYDHVLPLTHLSCREAFIKAGFEVTKVVDRFIPFSTDSKLPQHPLLVKMYLRAPLLWRFFGGQFVIVARKPTDNGNGQSPSDDRRSHSGNGLQGGL